MRGTGLGRSKLEGKVAEDGESCFAWNGAISALDFQVPDKSHPQDKEEESHPHVEELPAPNVVVDLVLGGALLDKVLKEPQEEPHCRR